MRRTRRHKFLQISVFFLIYSCIHVYSEHLVKRAEVVAKEKEPAKLSNVSSTTTIVAQGTPETRIAGTTMQSDLGPHGHPTWRPKRTNCTPPAIEQFPRPLMRPWGRRHGGIIIHVLVAVYTFLGLAIVCDEYFVASLDRICEELKLSPDVAGATFMAAGSSAPELATVIIGVFFAKDDIGVSGVIGSAVFNIMFVISVCALCTSTISYLNWWPLIRDCFFYALSILVMLFTIYDDSITWGESLFMLFMYVGYCVTLHFNQGLERWAQTLPVPFKPTAPEEESGLVSYKTLEEERNKRASYGSPDKNPENAEQGSGENLRDPSLNQVQTEPVVQQPPVPQGVQHGFGENLSGPSLNQVQNGHVGQQPPVPQSGQQGFGENLSYPSMNQVQNGNVGEQPPAPQSGQQGFGENLSGPSLNQVQTEPVGQQPPVPQGTQQGYYRPKESDPNAPDPLVKPIDGTVYQQAWWAIVFPIHYMCRKTMPDCKSEKYKNWYPFTFFVSMVWISFYSYFMVWMITIIGSTLGIPDTVMGLTFVAAGVSVPDALSSIAVIKEGYGDMAVSNAVGSNVFDILVCLGLPWFIQTAIIKPGSHVNVISKGLTYSTLSLLSTVIFLVVAVHMNGWKLDRKLGIVLMIWYLIFITFASMYELNVFGELNPPECTSEY